MENDDVPAAANTARATNEIETKLKSQSFGIN